MPHFVCCTAKPAFLEYFDAVDDPRQAAKILYPFDEILLLVLCAVISGADNWTAIALYGQKKLDVLRRFLPFADGTPCHDQLGILFSRLDMEQFQQCFVNWVADLHGTLEGVIAVDGKTLRRSFDTASSKAAIHVISAWSCEQKLVLGQRKVDDKSNEITAIPQLLALLSIEGAIITIDAMGCQRTICQQIIAQKADYVIGLKGNQGTLREDVELFFDELRQRGIADGFIKQNQTVDGDHGRIEMRKHTVIEHIDWLGQRHKWPGLKSVIMVEYSREIKGKTKTARRYYISSLNVEPVRDIAHRNALLFLWTTMTHIPDALRVIEAWGFRYITNGFTRVKTNAKSGTPVLGMGYWTRQNAELCLLAKRGRPCRRDNSISSIVISPRRLHSLKPDQVRRNIVRICGKVPRIELFARRKSPGWDIWGNELANDIKL